jgi:hypothetical protein
MNRYTEGVRMNVTLIGRTGGNDGPILLSSVTTYLQSCSIDERAAIGAFSDDGSEFKLHRMGTDTFRDSVNRMIRYNAARKAGLLECRAAVAAAEQGVIDAQDAELKYWDSIGKSARYYWPNDVERANVWLARTREELAAAEQQYAIVAEPSVAENA